MNIDLNADGKTFRNEYPARITYYGYEHQSDLGCPRHLVGKRCQGLGVCWCNSRLNDHAATYTRYGRQVTLWEPYSVWPEEFHAVASAAAADGLRVSLTGRSPYNPGSTLALKFSAEERTAR